MRTAGSGIRDGRSARVIGGHFKVLSFIILVYLVVVLTACGKKGPPTLKSYERPPAPVLISAYHNEGGITLSWSFPGDKEEMTEDFVILKAAEGDFSRIAFPASTARSFIDRDFRPGVHYRYKVVARNHRGMLSNASNILSVTPVQLPRPPEELSFVVKGNTIILSWKQEKDLRYNIYKGMGKGQFSPSPINASPLSGNSYTDAFDVNRIVSYSVRSLAVTDIVNEGPPSSGIEIDPFAFVPSAPKGLRAFAAPDRVILSWDEAPEPWVTGFRVYRRTGDRPYEPVGRTQIPTFVDMEPPLVETDYMVTATGPGKEGPGAETKGVIYQPQE